jgi:hypothetical protein
MNFPRILLLPVLVLLPQFHVALADAKPVPPELVWDFKSPATTPTGWVGLHTSLSTDSANLTPDGERPLVLTLHHSRDELQWASPLTFQTDTSDLKNTRAIEVTGWIKGKAGIAVIVRATGARGDLFTDSHTVTLTGNWQRIHVNQPLTRPFLGGWMALPRLIVDKHPTGEIFLGPVHVKLHADGGPPPNPAARVGSAPPDWRPIDSSELHIHPGSALDFTPFAERSPAGAQGRVVVNPRGELVLARKPDQPLRFLSLQWLPPRYEFSDLTDAQIAAQADAIARQGYNLIRLHFLDDFINGNAKAASLKNPPLPELPQRPEDIRWDERAIDRVRLFLAELKKRGVYWNVDLMTSFVGYTNGTLQYGGTVSKSPFHTKAQLYVNPSYRANWRVAVTRLLTEVNPYTGLALKDDPALALASCLNEQEILIPERKYGSTLDPVWHQYLKKKYGTYAALHKAWNGRCGDRALPAPDPANPASFAQVPSIDPVALTNTPAGLDMAKACGEMEYEVSGFYLRTLQEIGYTGLVSNWNMRTRIGTVPARSLFPVVTMNSYHAHPHFGAHTTVEQRSALAMGGNSFKGQALARFLDRPFINTEYNLVFWNRFRHEQGLLHGAGAALQGWNGLTCHATQVVASGAPITSFNIGDDPILRASELVTAFVFRRGDVSPSPHTIEIPLTDEFIYQGGRALRALDDELSRLWTLCRVGITYGEKRFNYPTVLSVSPDKTSSISGSQMFSTVESSDTTARLTGIATKLRELKVLAPGNITNPGAGILQSDTGQVTLNTAAGGELFIRTPRLEGAVLKTDHRVSLGALTIEECTRPAAITLISLDPASDATLRTARRLLLVLATDARNSNMRLSGKDENTLDDIGTLPVLVRTTRLKLSLDRPGLSSGKSVHVYALKLNGERAEEVSATIGAGTLTLDLDTQNLTVAGPTPFYEIVLP